MGDPSRMKGIVMVLLSAVFWGGSGAAAQFLFQQQNVSVEWLVTVRLLISGFVLLSWAAWNTKWAVLAIWNDRFSRVSLLLFSLLGMVGVQYTFFEAIASGNAATATVLQYLAPVLIVLYFAMQSKAMPAFREAAAVFLSLIGTFFLVTGGRLGELSISGAALFWGLGSALALAFYTVYPIELLKRWGSIAVVGWAMTLGGVIFSFVHPPWNFEGEPSFSTVAAILFVVIFGTLMAFYFYLESLRYLRPSETSLLACVEPLSAVLLSVLLLNVAFGFGEWLGTLCIIATVLILSRVKKEASYEN